MHGPISGWNGAIVTAFFTNKKLLMVIPENNNLHFLSKICLNMLAFYRHLKVFSSNDGKGIKTIK